MPIRPENRQAHWGALESDILFPSELAHVEGLRSIGFDPLAQPALWEVIIARMLGGETTSHKSEHDIEAEIGGIMRYVEVKFSTGHRCKYSPIRGRDYSHEQFRWAKPRGKGGKDAVDAIVLVGRAMSGLVYSWVLPLGMIARGCSSIAIKCPEERATDGWRWDRYAVPFDQLLPAIARIARGDLPPPPLIPKEAERLRVLERAGQIQFALECGVL